MAILDIIQYEKTRTQILKKRGIGVKIRLRASFMAETD